MGGGGGGGVGNFQLARIFFSTPCLCRNFFAAETLCTNFIYLFYYKFNSIIFIIVQDTVYL